MGDAAQRQVGVTRSWPGMGDPILHELSDGRFSLWVTTRRPRRWAERFEVIEQGAGVRGNARSPGHAPTLEAALELVATLEPSTPAEILAPIRGHRWANDGDRALGEFPFGRVEAAVPPARLTVTR